MSERLSRGQIHELLFLMNSPETDGPHYAKFHDELMAHDAALREELARVSKERDRWRHDAQLLVLRDRNQQELESQLAAAVAREARLVKALQAITRRVPIMGSKDEYRRGQDHALEACREVAKAALAEHVGEKP